MPWNALVIGATGKVGAEIVKGLAARHARVRAATRQPARFTSCAPNGPTAVEFDYDRPETFAGALDEVNRLFLSVRPGDERADETAIPLIEAALRRGVRRIVTLTAMGVEHMEETALRRIERRIEASQVEWTHLRPNFFMQIFAVPPLLDQVRAGMLRLPTAGARLSFVDVRDVAAVAVAALLDEGHEGKGYTLTGEEALDHHAVAAMLSAAAGRTIEYVPIEEGEARQVMTAAGLGGDRVERLLRFYRLVRAGACAPVSPAVRDVLGRPPIPFDHFVHDYAPCWGVGEPRHASA